MTFRGPSSWVLKQDLANDQWTWKLYGRSPPTAPHNPSHSSTESVSPTYIYSSYIYVIRKFCRFYFIRFSPASGFRILWSPSSSSRQAGNLYLATLAFLRPRLLHIVMGYDVIPFMGQISAFKLSAQTLFFQSKHTEFSIPTIFMTISLFFG